MKQDKALSPNPTPAEILRLLTAIRWLPRPVVQVSIGEQQVNVSG